MAEMSGILITLDTLKRCTRRLDNEQRGQLLTAIINFCENGVLDEIEDPALDLAADVITSEIQRMDDKYQEKRQKAKASAEQRWQKEKPGNSNTDDHPDATPHHRNTNACERNAKDTVASGRNANAYERNAKNVVASSRNANACEGDAEKSVASSRIAKNKNTNTKHKENPKGNEKVKLKDDNEENTNTNGEELSHSDSSLSDADAFDLREEDIRKAREMDAAIEDQAERYGFGRISEGRMVGLRDLAAEYGLEWLLKAIEMADRQQKHTWAYVEGVLRNARNDGKMDAGPPGSTAQSEEDLRGWMEVLGNGI